MHLTYPCYLHFSKELNFANFIGTIVYDKWQLSFERVFKKNEELECGYLDVAPNVELRYKVEFYTGTRQKVVLSEAAAGAETVQPQPLCLENGQGVVEAMEELLEKGTCSDVKIICGGEEIAAHKAVLVARAEVDLKNQQFCICMGFMVIFALSVFQVDVHSGPRRGQHERGQHSGL